MTAGGTSTCPWTFEGQVSEFDEKTIRYPGHYHQMKAIYEMGLLDCEPVKVGELEVVPRDLFHAVAEPKLRSEDSKDLALLRVIVSGDSNQTIFELIDYFDPATGFSAMQRTTGFGAAIVGIMTAHGELPKGSVRIEEAVNSEKYITEMRKRGFNLTIENC